LLLSSGKNQSIKIWDAYNSECITTLIKHNNNVNSVKWHKNGYWFITCSDDTYAKLFDIRKLENEIHSYKCSSDIRNINWHT